MKHGTSDAYSNHECRCDACTEAWRIYQQQRRRLRRELIRLEPHRAVHGKWSTYCNWGCRCRACTAASHAHYLIKSGQVAS